MPTAVFSVKNYIRALYWMPLCASACGHAQPEPSGETPPPDGTQAAPTQAAPTLAGTTAPTATGLPLPQELSLAWETPGPDASRTRYEAQGLALGRKLYVFGGFVEGSGWPVTTEGEVFDLDTQTWTPFASAPDALTHSGRATDGRYLYFVGGFVGDGPGGSTDHAWRYDPATDTWQALTPLPEQRGAGGLVLLGTTLHYFGGAIRPPDEDIISSDHGEHWALDATDPSAQWSPLAAMPNPRNHLGAAVIGNTIYAVGGQHFHDEEAGNLAFVDAYDAESDEWRSVASLPVPIGHLTSNTLEYKGRLLVVSGITQESTKLDTVFAFDPEQDTWSELTPLPEPRHSPVSGIIGDTLIVTGGSLSTARQSRAQTWLGKLQLE